MSATALIFLSVTRMYGWSRVASSLPPSVLVDEVGADVAAVELHALDVLDLELQALATPRR